MTFAARTLGSVAGPNFGPISGNLTAATFDVVSNGYRRSPSAGTMSPSSFPAGQLVESWSDTSGVTSSLSISGFGANPTQTGFFTTATYNGVARTAAAATSYSYASGTATWTWNSLVFGFASNVGVSRAFSIT